MVVLVLLAAGFPSWFYVQKRMASIFEKARLPAPTEKAPEPAKAVEPPKRKTVPPPANHVAHPPVPSPAQPEAHAPGTPAPLTDPMLLAETLRTQVAPQAQKCLSDWKQLDPNFAGKVTVSLIFKPTESLSSVDLLEQEQVPEGPLACFGTALWEQSWPAVTAPLTVTYPFEITPEVRELDKEEH